MNLYSTLFASRVGLIPAILAVAGVVAGCGGGLDPILGTPSFGAAPTVTATFSEAMAAATISGTSFTVTNTTLGTPVAGTR